MKVRILRSSLNIEAVQFGKRGRKVMRIIEQRREEEKGRNKNKKGKNETDRKKEKKEKKRTRRWIDR